MKRIVVDPPVGDARRERVERQLFAKLATVRITDRADAVIPTPRKSRFSLGLGFAGFAVAAAIALLLFTTRDGDRGGPVSSPSRVVTPVGAESQFSVGDAVMIAKSDTRVEIKQAADGAITLVLERGAVECDVPPRNGRPLFRVVAGDMTVIVVGTRFTVTKSPNQRVDVVRGKVRVEAPGGKWLVEAGEYWTPSVQTAVAPVEPPVEEAVEEPEEIEMDAMRVGKTPRPPKKPAATPATAEPVVDPPAVVQPPKTRELAKLAYRQAQALENRDPALAAANYRAIAQTNHNWAPHSLVSLAELQLKMKNAKGALETLDEHDRRFPTAGTREDAAWFRIEALRAMGKRDEARGAAANYLREFPDGAFAKLAARLTK